MTLETKKIPDALGLDKYGNFDFSSANEEYKTIIDIIKNFPETIQTELVHVFYPLFVQFYIELTINNKTADALKFWEIHSSKFLQSIGYEESIKQLKTLSTFEDIKSHPTFHLFRSNKCSLQISKYCKELFLKLLNEFSLFTTLRILDSYFILDPVNDFSESHADLLREDDLKNIAEVNELSPPLPYISLYSLQHSSNICGIDLSQDKTMIAGGCVNSSVCLWKPLQLSVIDNNVEHENFDSICVNKTMVELRGHKSTVTNVEFHSLNTLLFSCSTDCTVRAWSLDDCETAAIYSDIGDSIWDVSLSPDGLNFAATSANAISYLFDLTRTKPLLTLSKHESDVNCGHFILDGKGLATGSNDKTVRLWSLQSKDQITDPLNNVGNVFSLALSPYNGYIASAGEGNFIHIWDSRHTSACVQKLYCDMDMVHSLSYNTNGRILAAAGSEKIIFYDLNVPNLIFNEISFQSSIKSSFRASNSDVRFVSFDSFGYNLSAIIIPADSLLT